MIRESLELDANQTATLAIEAENNLQVEINFKAKEERLSENAEHERS